MAVENLCTCGYHSPDKREFNTHLMRAGNAEPGKHKSKGAVDLESGEVVHPPYKEMTAEQRNEVRRAKKAAKREAKNRGNGGAAPPPPGETPAEPLEETPRKQQTRAPRKDGGAALAYVNDPSLAMLLRVIPKAMQIELTPIMRSGFVSAINEWGWPPEMTFTDYLDTVIARYHEEHGIKLGAYVVYKRAGEVQHVGQDETRRELPEEVAEEEKEDSIATEEKQPEEVPSGQ